MQSVVWDVNCEFAGSFRSDKRFCRKKGKWMSFEDCFRCLKILEVD